APAIHKPNKGIFSAANTYSIFGNNVKNRLNISRRAGDHAQDFTRGSLLLQRLFEFLEQSHVLDGNRRLVGEGFEKRDLLVCKRENSQTTEVNDPERDSVFQ